MSYDIYSNILAATTQHQVLKTKTKNNISEIKIYYHDYNVDFNHKEAVRRAVYEQKINKIYIITTTRTIIKHNDNNNSYTKHTL